MKHPFFPFSQVGLVGVTAVLGWVGWGSAAWADELELELIGMRSWPTGETVGGVEIRDLSGIGHDRETDTFHAVNDSGGAGQARLFRIRLDYDENGFYGKEAMGSVRLSYPNGTQLPSIDAEGLAWSWPGSVFVSTEGRAGQSNPDSRDPWIWEFDATNGRRVGVVPVPGVYLPRAANGQPVAPGADSQFSGVRSNLGLESLTLSHDGRTLFTANEAALLQDDARVFDSTFNQAQNSDIRITRFVRDGENWIADGQKVYRADQGHLVFIVRAFNSVSSILSLDNAGRLLVLERGLTQASLSTGSYRIRLYEVDFNDPAAEDVSDVFSLAGQTVGRLGKRLVWESTSGLDNIEGMSFGRDVAGRRSLVMVSDNNSAADQETQFLVFRTNLPAPVPVVPSWEGPGTVEVEPARPDYLPGGTVTLRAIPHPGRSLVGWSAAAGDNALARPFAAGVGNVPVAEFGNPYAAWMRGWFTREEFAAGALGNPLTPDPSGVPHLFNYAFGRDPLAATNSANPLTVSTGANGETVLAFDRPRPTPAVSYGLEQSDNLVDWTAVDLQSHPGAETSVLNGRERVTITEPAAGTGFFRLTVVPDWPD